MFGIVIKHLVKSLLLFGWRLFVFLFLTVIPTSLAIAASPSKKAITLYWIFIIGSFLIWLLRDLFKNFSDMKIELFCFSERKRLAKFYEAKEKARHNVSKRTQLRDSIVRSQEPLSLQDAYNKGFQNGFRSGFKYTDKVKNRLKNQEMQKKEIHLCEQVRKKMERLCS